MKARVWVAVFVAGAVAVLAVPELLEKPPVVHREPPSRSSVTPQAERLPVIPDARGAVPPTPPEPADRSVDERLADLAAALRADDRDLARAILETLRERMIPPPVADEDNAALLYQRAFTLIGELKLTDAEKELIRKEPPLSDEELAQARGLWERCGPAMALLTEAARRPACRFPLDYADGFDMELPHVAPSMTAARILRLGTLLGEGGAADRTMASLRLAQGIRNDGILISTLVATAIDRTLQASTGPDLDALIEQMDPAAGREDFRRTMAFETVSAIDLLLNKSPEEVARVFDDPGAFPPGTLQAVDLPAHVEWMQEVIRLTELPFYEVRERLAALESEAADAPTITRLLAPALSRARLMQSTDESRLSLMKLGSALERHRSAQGRYPESLEALGIPIPLDPVTGLPYVYAPDGGGYLLANAATEKDERVEWRIAR